MNPNLRIPASEIRPGDVVLPGGLYNNKLRVKRIISSTDKTINFGFARLEWEDGEWVEGDRQSNRMKHGTMVKVYRPEAHPEPVVNEREQEVRDLAAERGIDLDHCSGCRDSMEMEIARRHGELTV